MVSEVLFAVYAVATGLAAVGAPLFALFQVVTHG